MHSIHYLHYSTCIFDYTFFLRHAGKDYVGIHPYSKKTEINSRANEAIEFKAKLEQ